MRKAIFTLALATITVLGFAQVPEAPAGQLQRLQQDVTYTTEANQPRAGKAVVDVEEWFGWYQDWAAFEGGFRQQSSFFVLYPDTFVKHLFLDDETNTTTVSSNAWCSAGTGFDPKSPAWSDPAVPGVRDWFGYNLDSVKIHYGYFRQNPDESVVDTLLIQVYRNAGTGGQMTTGSFVNDQSIFAIPQQNRRLGIGGMNFTHEIKYPLTAEDAVVTDEDGSFTIKNITVAINGEEGMDVMANQVAHVTVSFKPGQDYEFGDTLYFDPDLKDFGETEPVKKLNRFGIIIATQTPNISPLNSFNNGSFIVRWNRHEDPDNFPFNGYYYPNRFGDGTTSYAYYPHIAYHFRANYDAVGVGEMGTESNVDIFPNPANGQTNMQFSLESDEQVNIAIYDLTGKKVMDVANGAFAAGDHTVSFDVSAMDAGMYIYTMTAGEQTTSAKFNVAK